MAVAVNVEVYSDTNHTTPLPGVLVAIVDKDTFELITSAVTQDNGVAAFLLEPAIYEARFFKRGAAFQNPVSIEVGTSPAAFPYDGELLTLPTSLDARCCRCTGEFRDFSNRPVAGALLRVSAIANTGYQTPRLVDGALISPSATEFRTDENGRVSFDLLRGGEYYVAFAGEDDETWNLKVPNRSSANLIGLIFPQPVEFLWNPDEVVNGGISLKVGETREIHFSLRFSDDEVLTSGAQSWVGLSAPSSAVTVALDDGRLLVTGMAPGSADIVLPPVTETVPYRVPAASFSVPTLHVTVTE